MEYIGGYDSKADLHAIKMTFFHRKNLSVSGRGWEIKGWEKVVTRWHRF